MLRNLMICYNIHYDMVRYDVIYYIIYDMHILLHHIWYTYIYDVILGDNMYAHSFI